MYDVDGATVTSPTGVWTSEPFMFLWKAQISILKTKQLTGLSLGYVYHCEPEVSVLQRHHTFMFTSCLVGQRGTFLSLKQMFVEIPDVVFI